jgi:hypothetical protein
MHHQTRRALTLRHPHSPARPAYAGSHHMWSTSTRRRTHARIPHMWITCCRSHDHMVDINKEPHSDARRRCAGPTLLDSPNVPYRQVEHSPRQGRKSSTPLLITPTAETPDTGTSVKGTITLLQATLPGIEPPTRRPSNEVDRTAAAVKAACFLPFFIR